MIMTIKHLSSPAEVVRGHISMMACGDIAGGREQMGFSPRNTDRHDHGLPDAELSFQELTSKSKAPVHPGAVLLNRYLIPRHITQSALAEHLGVSVQRINEIVRGKRSITPETSWLLAGALGTTPELWISLQVKYDMAHCKPVQEVTLLKDGRRKRRQKQRAATPCEGLAL